METIILNMYGEPVERIVEIFRHYNKTGELPDNFASELFQKVHQLGWVETGGTLSRLRELK